MEFAPDLAISGQAISHSKGEHGNALREALRGQLPLTEDDIVLTLSAIKNGQARVTAPGRTNRGTPSIIQTVPVNGYTLYTEEINKKSWSDVSDLISHSMWKAPTLATAAASGTSPVALPKRQSQVLSSYSITQNGKTSTANFVADKNGNAVPLYYEEINGRPYRDTQNGGLAFLSADRSVANAALTRGGITQAYAIMTSRKNSQNRKHHDRYD